MSHYLPKGLQRKRLIISLN